MPNKHTINVVSYYRMAVSAGGSTLVPHANAIEVAAMTDTTLAALNLLPDIAVLIRRLKVFEMRSDYSSPCLHDGEASNLIATQDCEPVDVDGEDR